MKLKEVRKLGIKYCEENDCSYTYISYDNIDEFYLTEQEDKHTVYLVNKNGSFDAYLTTKYAFDFHKDSAKRDNGRGKGNKRKIAEMCNHDYESDDGWN